MARDKKRIWLRPLAFAALGFGAGALFGGGKMVRVYDWVTNWNIDAPISQVFKVLTTPEEFSHWWPSAPVHSVMPLAGIPQGRKIVYRVKSAGIVALLKPFFQITTLMTDIEKDRRFRSVTTGELVGVAETMFYSRSDGGTRIVFYWYVRIHHPFLNALGFVLEPVFRASHDHFMKEGETRLQRYCQESFSTTPEEEKADSSGSSWQKIDNRSM